MSEEKTVPLRIIFRYGQADLDGRLAGYEIKTCVVEIPKQMLDKQWMPEIIGGEWLKEGE